MINTNTTNKKIAFKKIALVFPGQGSQHVGMLNPLDRFQHSSIVQNRFKQASDILGYDLFDLVQNGPEHTLNLTEFTQPALLTASLAYWDYWCEEGVLANQQISPSLLAGHSLGEYTALVSAGSLSFEEALAAVRERGRLMQQAVPKDSGAMAAVLGLSDEAVANACRLASSDKIVSPANFNAPGQVVIAGHKEAVEKASIEAKALGAKRVIPLPVSVPSHCALMKDAATRLAKILSELSIKAPNIPVCRNVDAGIHETDSIVQSLVSQLYQPVQWVKTIQMMKNRGIEVIFECGPGQVLSGLIKRIEPSITVLSVLTKDTDAIDSGSKDSGNSGSKDSGTTDTALSGEQHVSNS